VTRTSGEKRHAERVLYGDGLALEGKDAADPMGMTCRTCPRGDRAHRAFPSAHQPVPRTDFIRAEPLFATP
jgi:hypothetical protein